MMNSIVGYIDGACSNNPGPGGWGVLLLKGNTATYLSGYEENTTNNRMEIKSAIELFKYLNFPCEIILYTDSKYLRDGISLWIHNWMRNSWMTSAKKPVKNTDLWKELVKLSNMHQVTWKWVKGHADDVGNKIADSLAVLAKYKQ